MHTRKLRRLALLLAAGAFAAGAACRGQLSEEPPVHINPNLDDQARYKAYGQSTLFPDGRTMRTPPPGTVAREGYSEDEAYTTGKAQGLLVAHLPVELTAALLDRGESRFDIYCAVCHDRAGTGQGLVPRRGFTLPPTFHDDRLRAVEDGHLFDVITNGVRTMPSYSAQVPVEDRWAIVAWIRVLQRSQYATLNDVPADQRQVLQ
jgi:mono/diheme cytochrome c family protein